MNGILEYTISGLDSACNVFNFAKLLDSTSTEHISERHVRFLYHLKLDSNTDFNIATLNDALYNSLNKFPTNTLFLNLFALNEKSKRINNKAAVVLDDLSSKINSHLLPLFYIWNTNQGGLNVNLIRSLFKKAVSNEGYVFAYSRSYKSPELWYLYLKFEIKNKNYASLKDLFFRACKECPWVKALYLIGISELNELFNADEIEELGLLLQEKEMRVRLSFPMNE